MQRTITALRHAAARRRFATTSTIYVDGAAAAASDGQTIKTHSPADGSVLAELSDASADDARRAVAAAARCHASGPSFRAAAARRDALERAAAALREDATVYATNEARDCGKTFAEAEGDVAYCADMLDYYAGLVEDGTTRERRAPPPAAYGLDAACTVATYPAGVAALVTPWNYPLLQAVLKVAPAVAAGCPFVLKPSPLASLTCVDFLQTILGPLSPPGACNLLTGGPPLSGSERGAGALLADPRVAVCSFTGSSRGGEAVLNAAAPFARPSALELGGKGALIVLDDADVEAAADQALVGILSCAGQVCSATSRLLIQRPIFDAVVERVLEKMAAVVVGKPLDAATTMGPLVSREQQERVLGFVERARQAALDVRQPARPQADASGYFAPPTLVTGDLEGAEIWREEVFGPVLCAMPFESDADAIALANASRFGLAHAVFSADEARAAKCADALDAGVVWVNANQVLWPDTPFGGWKASGFGFEQGREGMAPFLRRKSVVVAPPSPGGG